MKCADEPLQGLYQWQIPKREYMQRGMNRTFHVKWDSALRRMILVLLSDLCFIDECPHHTINEEWTFIFQQ
jgi:hypothetical protein